MDARRAAYEALTAVESGEYADRALDKVLGNVADQRDRALATEITYGVLRWQSSLDEELRPRVRPSTDAKVIRVLRIGLYQLRFLERVPHRAALHATVDLTKRLQMPYASGMVNAVLRNILREEERPKPTGNTVEEMAVRYAHPAWLVQAWQTTFGVDAAEGLLKADQEIARPVLRIRDGQVDAAMARLKEEGWTARRGQYATHAVVVLEGPPLVQHPMVREGRWVLQDEGAQAMAALLPPAQEHLDLCAAPGGKAFLLADRDADSRIFALEADALRAQQLRTRRDILGLSSRIDVEQGDARRPAYAGKTFLSVLVDAPCSGIGTLRRNPDRKWRGEPDPALPLLQGAILEQAAKQVAPGGHLLYITCTLWEPENEDVVAQFEAGHSAFTRVSPDHPFRRDDGLFQARPDVHGTDGFFAALWRRV